MKKYEEMVKADLHRSVPTDTLSVFLSSLEKRHSVHA